MIALRPRDQSIWDPRPVLHETEAETKTNYCETETKKWSRDHAVLETLTSMYYLFMNTCIWMYFHRQQLSQLVLSCVRRYGAGRWEHEQWMRLWWRPAALWSHPRHHHLAAAAHHPQHHLARRAARRASVGHAALWDQFTLNVIVADSDSQASVRSSQPHYVTQHQSAKATYAMLSDVTGFDHCSIRQTMRRFDVHWKSWSKSVKSNTQCRKQVSIDALAVQMHSPAIMPFSLVNVWPVSQGHDFDLWPWMFYQQCPLIWWIFMANFHSNRSSE